MKFLRSFLPAAVIFLLAHYIVPAHPISQSYWSLKVSEKGLLVSRLVISLGDALDGADLEINDAESLKLGLESLEKALKSHFQLRILPGGRDLSEDFTIHLEEDQVLLRGDFMIPETSEAVRVASLLPQKTAHKHQVYGNFSGRGSSFEFLLDANQSVHTLNLQSVRPIAVTTRLARGLTAPLRNPSLLLAIFCCFLGLRVRSLLIAAGLFLPSLLTGYWTASAGLEIPSTRLLLPLLVAWIAFERSFSRNRVILTLGTLLTGIVGGSLLYVKETPPVLGHSWILLILILSAAGSKPLLRRETTLQKRLFLGLSVASLLLFAYRVVE